MVYYILPFLGNHQPTSKPLQEQRTMKVFNFNAGPAMIPQAVMEKAQKEFCDY